MDRFSEQLIVKYPSTRDNILKVLIALGTAAVLGLLVFLFFLFGYGILIAALALGAGAAWLGVWLLQGLYTEYEYIVTNDDLDIDKISGKRRRKRLITVSLSTVTELARYEADTSLKSDVTVMAHDESGEDMWYLISRSDSYGELAVIFNPDRRTVENIVSGMAPKVKHSHMKLLENSGDGTETETEEEE